MYLIFSKHYLPFGIKKQKEMSIYQEKISGRKNVEPKNSKKKHLQEI